MGPLFGVCGFFGLVVSLVVICVKAITKKPKKNAAIAICICTALFIMGFVLDSTKKDKEAVLQASVASVTEDVIDKSIPNDIVEEDGVEEKVEVSTEELTTETTTEEITENNMVEKKDSMIDTEETASAELVVTDLETTTATEASTEGITEVTTELTTEVTTELTNEEIATEEEITETVVEYDYVLNTNTKKFHKPTCNSVNQMKEKNKQEFHGTRDEVISKGYEPCKNCNP